MSGLMLRLFRWLSPLPSYALDTFTCSREAKHVQPRAGIQPNPGTRLDDMLNMGLPA